MTRVVAICNQKGGVGKTTLAINLGAALAETLAAFLAPATERYDRVLIDCPPALGNLTDNALDAARRVVVPIQVEPTSVRALDLLFDQIESLERGLGVRVEVTAVVPNLVQRSGVAARIVEELRRAVGAVTPFELRKRVVLQDVWNGGRSTFRYVPSTPAHARARQAAIEGYRQLAAFVCARTPELQAA
jgi:cellulose biosynthesis protein BcsQ